MKVSGRYRLRVYINVPLTTITLNETMQNDRGNRRSRDNTNYNES